MVAERPRRMNDASLLMAYGGMIDTFLYPLAGMAEMGEPANVFTDALIHYIAETQDPSGGWIEEFARPPLQESDITRTMFAIMALKTYGWPARRAEFDERIARGRGWLLTARTWTTVDEADRVMGLWLAGGDQTDLRKSGEKLLLRQRADGGWAQTEYLDSDAFGTAAVLYSLRRAGLLDVSAAAYQRGARFLLDTSVSRRIVVRAKPGGEASAVFPKWISVRSRSVDFERGDRVCRDGARSGVCREVASYQALDARSVFREARKARYYS